MRRVLLSATAASRRRSIAATRQCIVNESFQLQSKKWSPSIIRMLASYSHGGASSAMNGTFVSSYNDSVSSSEISSFLQRKQLVSKEGDTHFVIRDCPFCHATRGKIDNLFKLYVHKSKGMYKCHRCGASGSWFDFKRKLQDNVSVSSGDHIMHGTGREEPVKVIEALDNQKAMSIQQNLMDDPEFSPALEYVTQTRAINQQTLRKYGVGALEQPFRNDSDSMENVQCLSFPWMARQSDLDAMGVMVNQSETTPSSSDQNLFNVVRLKLRGVENKTHQRLIPKGGSWGLFGWHTVPSSADEIVLTEGEFDAMSVNQATGLPAVSLPNGCQSLPPAVLPLLERFSKIYLWVDNDMNGQASVEKFAHKLGMSRCYIVHMSQLHEGKAVKDANDALRAGMDLTHLIHKAERIPHSQIATFEQLRNEVYEEVLNPIRACGVQSRTLPGLNRLLKGHRMGEMTVLTGPTGCGKTTLLSQLSMDLCEQGVNTLWGSFEIKNTRLLHKMLTQLAGKSLAGDMEAFDRAADAFETLPMYFLRFFGSSDVDEVLDAMEYAVYAYDVQHILLDNVQFMMSGQGRGYDKFERQDAALDKFRKFASQKNVHVTLVIHPRKEQEDQELTLSSVFGTAKATQEADNVLILQRTRGDSKLDVRKNRFDGSLGSIPLQFDEAACSLREYNEDTMREDVSSIAMEAQMEREQRYRLNSLQAEEEMAETQVQEQTYVAEMASKMNGQSKVNGHHSWDDDDEPKNGDLNGGSSGLPRRSSDEPSAEPFAAFTPIISR